MKLCVEHGQGRQRQAGVCGCVCVGGRVRSYKHETMCGTQTGPTEAGWFVCVGVCVCVGGVRSYKHEAMCGTQTGPTEAGWCVCVGVCVWGGGGEKLQA